MGITAEEKVSLEGLLKNLASKDPIINIYAAREISDIAAKHKMSIPDLMKASFIAGKFIHPEMFVRNKDKQTPTSPPSTPVVVKEVNYGFPINILDDDALIQQMQDLILEWGIEPLTSWEINFSSDIFDRRPCSLSEKQRACVERIVEKLSKCGTNDF
jgi:hypothetical protein